MRKPSKLTMAALTLGIAATTLALTLFVVPVGAPTPGSSTNHASTQALWSHWAAPRPLASALHGGSPIAHLASAPPPSASTSVRPYVPVGDSSGNGPSGYHAMHHCSMGAHDNRLKA
jgi:hypothetical protein